MKNDKYLEKNDFTHFSMLEGGEGMSVVSSTSNAAILANLRTITLVRFGDIPMLVDPVFNEVYCDSKKSDLRSQSLAKMRLIVDKSVFGGSYSARAFFQRSFELNGLVWNIAMHESVPAESIVNTQGGRFSLLSWPRLGEWEAAKNLASLAATLIGTPVTLAQAASDAGLAKEQVKKFMRACILARVGVTVEI